MRDVSVVGPLNIDLLITGQGPPNWESIPTWDGPSDMEMTAAGSVGYTVQNLARLGLSVRISSCLPDDPLGAFILDALQRAEIDTRSVNLVPDTVGGIGVYMLLFGSRKRPLTYRLPTHPMWPLEFSSEEIDTLLDAKLLHNGGYLHYKDAWHGATRDLFKEAKARGLITSLDSQFPLFAMSPPWIVGLEDVLPSIDIFMCDDGEARHLTAASSLDEAARILLDAGTQTVIIKQGDQGSTVYQQGWQHHQDAIVLGELVDSIGAGDTFDAGFLYGTLQNWPLEKRMLFASIAAGFTVTGVGGSQTMPSQTQVMIEMEKRESRFS
ncbi:MAG: carbohydrate kinase family protein [Anaerolineae bacterium]|jgi:sugar/nucleoside kinase (ribokinase family)|nr:MAG: carbohydrate kinase family protein [Anaerolineae bacterium]